MESRLRKEPISSLEVSVGVFAKDNSTRSLLMQLEEAIHCNGKTIEEGVGRSLDK